MSIPPTNHQDVAGAVSGPAAGWANQWPLVAASLASETHRKYTMAVQRFDQWYTNLGLLINDMTDLDVVLCDYIHSMWAENDKRGQRQWAVYTKCGIEYYMPAAKGQLGISERALQGWDRLNPASCPPPVSWDVALAISVDLWINNQNDAAIIILLAHDCYLRVGEALRLRVSDFDDPGRNLNLASLDPEFGSACLRLGRTKTGRNQFVTIRDPLVLDLLRRHVVGRRPTDRLFDVSYSKLRTNFHSALHRIGADGVCYVLHSLRHGGATRDFLRNIPMLDIVHRGRWAKLKGARRYVNAGAASFTEQTMSALTRRCVTTALLNTRARFGLV